MLDRALSAALTEVDPAPVLVDVGASGAPPEIWLPIAAASTYVGFDPDDRDLAAAPQGFARAVILRQAVAAAAEEITYRFTRSPHCSSSLEPLHDQLEAYLFAPLFDVLRREKLATMTLDQALSANGLHGPDWLKVDSQGTDLRIFMGLSEPRRSRVLAVDLEPGLIDAYAGEDLFVDVHRELTRQGFWLSRLLVGENVRLRPAAAREIERRHPGLTPSAITLAQRGTPVCCEVRYLRSAPAAVDDAGTRAPLLLALFAMLDGQFAFAYECLLALESRVPGRVVEDLRRACAAALRRPSSLRTLVRRILPAAVRRPLRRISGISRLA